MTIVSEDGIAAVAELVAAGRVMLLSGAGLSTESGIPDYRGPTGTARRHMPMTYSEFIRSEAGRRRYWARSHLGWKVVAAAQPNSGHYAVAALQAAGRLSGVVTQNVDGLHEAGGADAVIKLHGSLSTVVCLTCGIRTPRVSLDERLRRANPQWGSSSAVAQPDGDAEIAADAVEHFTVVDCADCGGMLKPDVVFFGESVPKERVDRCFALLESSAALLVVGSSLQVMSGYRFVLRAAQMGLPVVIANQGATRGDHLASVRIDAPLGESLPDLVRWSAARCARS